MQWQVHLSSNEEIRLYENELDSKLTPRSFYNYLLMQLGCKPVMQRNTARDLLHKQIEIMRGMQSRKVVVIVDEAHLLSKEMLEER